jgi:hypothetical protein
MRGSGILGGTRRGRSGWLVVIAVAGVASGFAQGASASSKTHVAAGSFRINTDYKATNSGGAEISSGSYTGALVGAAIDTGTAVVGSNGSFSGHGIELCDPCAIGGKTGAFTATYSYSYSGSGKTYSGTETFTRGFGKLAGLTGGGSFKGNVNATVQTYSYSYHL